ncbi:unnamed protein product [Vitrella brassicaformis CCMP3155]|uniref:Uncharacterized protein n=1 Tax=Vitrella brassicaformis (strain CCMP3155) TaxID=1169540 RepID=A0A0G4EHD5_VITBC|nr:unnamed protein product [Vitrella brassicaformis CCMP3155]|eukprot:CEL95906.1 unnamed protein product [Vitrella brassicaformis CCMP3155]
MGVAVTGESPGEQVAAAAAAGDGQTKQTKQHGGSLRGGRAAEPDEATSSRDLEMGPAQPVEPGPPNGNEPDPPDDDYDDDDRR